MKKIRDILSISLFLVLILAVWAVLSSLPEAEIVHLPNVYGEHDLRDLDFDHHIYYSVDYWDSYPEKLYTPADFANGTVTEAPVILESADFKVVQYATHRLRLRLTPGVSYGMSMVSSDYAMRLFIDDREIDSVGVPGDSLETTVPRVDDRLYVFTPTSELTTLTVQAANFVHREGGWFPSIYIGEAQNILQMNRNDMFRTTLIAGVLLTAFLYHLGLFFVNRKRKSVLVFSFCCLLLMLFTKKPIPMFFPEYNWFIAIRAEYIIFYAAFAALTLFFDTLDYVKLNKHVCRAFYILSGLFALGTIVLQPLVFSQLILYFQILGVLMFLYILVTLAISLRHGTMKNILSFAGLLVVGLFVVNDIFLHNNWLQLEFFARQAFSAPVGMIFFMFCYALVLSIEHVEAERAMLDAQAKERSLAIDNAALDRVNRMKSDLLSTVSHETRTPLAVLSGYAELISMEMKRKGVDDQTLSDLEAIADETQRISVIMEEMQRFSRIKENAEHRARIGLEGIIRQIARLYAPILARRKTKLTVNLPENLPPVFADAGELTQVMFNLLQNARDHTEDGEVTINVELKMENGALIVVTVSDTGAGIPQELLPSVFKRSVSGHEDGTGLGLAICKEIIDAHGGTIGIDSQLGEGTTVRFTLPISADGGGHDAAKNGLIS